MSLLHDWSTPIPSDLSDAIARRQASGLGLVDLITANPHEHGFVCDAELVHRALMEGLASSAVYRPDARGRIEAREAVAALHGNGARAENVILTPGTSLAYAYAFRLLAESGGEILCPTPTYPLFDDLARMTGASVRRYHLSCDEGHWFVDPDEIAFQVTPATRILALVSPHNPTGMVIDADAMAAIAAIARRHDLAIIFDEVFRETLHSVDAVPRPSEFDAPLTLTLNGLSKRLSLPGLKAGWIVVEGDAPRRDAMLNALEYVSDTLLPVSEPVQGAMAMLLRDGEVEVQRLAALARDRMRQLLQATRDAGLRVISPDAGPYVLIPLDARWRRREEQLAVKLVQEEGIVLHPGSFYDVADPHLVATAVCVNAAALRRVGVLLNP